MYCPENNTHCIINCTLPWPGDDTCDFGSIQLYNISNSIIKTLTVNCEQCRGTTIKIPNYQFEEFNLICSSIINGACEYIHTDLHVTNNVKVDCISTQACDYGIFVVNGQVSSTNYTITINTPNAGFTNGIINVRNGDQFTLFCTGKCITTTGDIYGSGMDIINMDQAWV